MKNLWLVEKEIRILVTKINQKLTEEFLGCKTDIKEVSERLLGLLHDPSVGLQVRDSIVWRYNLEIMEKDGKVRKIEMIKLPWLV